MSAREWLARLRDRLRRGRLDDELAEELRFHREQLAQEGGQARLGNETRVREETRDRWGFMWLDALEQDVRYALRGIRRSPGFAATVIVTLGLGIGANAAMFGVIDRLMFRPYPYLRDPSSVNRVYIRSWYRGNQSTSWSMEYTRYLDIRRATTSFSQYAPYTDRTLAVGTGDASRERRLATVGSEFFSFFDAQPVLGRWFTAAEDSTPRGADVVVLGYGFWQSEYGGRDVLGRQLQIGNISATIIGVAPRGFVGIDDADPPVAFIPITTFAGAREAGGNVTYFTKYNWGWMGFMARRKPGVTVAQASADLSQAHVRSWNAEKALKPSMTPEDIAKPDAIAGALRLGGGPDPSLEARTARWVTGVALIVLLIACANVANLFLARALRRQREVAVRLALGVSRARLVRQAVTESLVLSALGCLAGLAVAQWGGAGVRQLLISRGASLDVLTDWRTIGIALVAGLAAALFTGIVPSLFAGWGDLFGALKAGTREGTYQRSRARIVLLVTQAALSVVLLVGAGLFVKSLDHVRSMRLGYDADGVLLVERNLRGMHLSDSDAVRLNRDLLAAAQAIPGIERAALISSLPFYSSSSTNLHVAGIDSVRRLGRFTYQTTTPDYFRVMGTRILRGRGITDGDRETAPKVVVVSESMARILWPGKDAIGACIRVGNDSVPCTSVVGIAEDIVERDFASSKRFQYYLPLEQHSPTGAWAVLARMRGDAKTQLESVRASLQRAMPGQGYVTVQSFGDIVDEERRSWRMGATMFVAFGVLALVVAGVGLYGVIGYNVAQRMHELGVRIALGAQGGDIRSLVVGQGLRFVIAGTVAGMILALWAARFVEPLLFQQSARDPAVYGLVAAILIAVGLIASIVPARRAMRADPNTALRSD